MGDLLLAAFGRQLHVLHRSLYLCLGAQIVFGWACFWSLLRQDRHKAQGGETYRKEQDPASIRREGFAYTTHDSLSPGSAGNSSTGASATKPGCPISLSPG